jgi:hypothetical protein
MTNTDCNGWTNYATWRVNLEIFDGFNPREYWQGAFEDAYDLSKNLADYAEELLANEATNDQSLVYSYAMAFIADVNWYEIAEHMIKEYSEEETV